MRRYLLPVLLAGASAAAAAQTPPAAPPRNAEPSKAEEITVTARKRAEKLREVPMGVTALGGRSLDENQRVQFADLAALVPGLSLQTVSRAENTLTIRGENANGAGSTVAIYVDDTPFGSSNALANGSIVTGNFETFDLARVEVLRGPQGTLYGATSEGGLLKFVTSPPRLGTYAGNVEFGAQDVAGGGSALLFKGMVNVPLGEKAALRVVAFDDGIPGWTNNPLLNTQDAGQGRTWGQRTSLLLQPTDALTIKLSAWQQQLNLSGIPREDVVGDALLQNPPPANLFRPLHDLQQLRYFDDRYRERLENYSATIGYDLDWAALTSITSWGVIRQDRNLDATEFLISPPSTEDYGQYVSSLVGQNVGVAQFQSIPLHKFTQELRLTSSSGGALDWQTGLFFTRESAAIEQHNVAISLHGGGPVRTVPVLADDLLTSVYDEVALYAEATYHFTPRFDLALGGRLAANSQRSLEVLAGALNGPQTVYKGGSREGVFTYSVAPRYHIGDDTLLYGRIATGYRPGGPNILPPVVPANVARTYGSDTTINYEVGLRNSVLGGRLTSDLAAFYINWNRIQLSETVDQTYSINGNGGTATSKGVEWAFGMKPLDDLTLSLVGSYVDAYLTSDAPGVGGRSRDPLVYVPHWSTSLDGDIKLTTVAGWGLSAGATVSYVGTRYWDFRSDLPASRIKMPDFTQLDLRLSARRANWFAQIYCKNATNARGIASFTPGGGYNATGDISTIQPLTAGLVVSRRF